MTSQNKFATQGTSEVRLWRKVEGKTDETG